MEEKNQAHNSDLAQEEPEVKNTDTKNQENIENNTEAQPTADELQEKAGESAESKLEKELAEQKDKYLRLYSEFENFRRRTAKEKLDMIKTANEDMAVALLPILDDFERAMQSLKISEEAAEGSVEEGFMIIYKKLSKTLEQKGVKQMNIEKGASFDSEVQEAITQIPAPEESLKGKVVDVVERGYLMGDKVIRFAKVVIGS